MRHLFGVAGPVRTIFDKVVETLRSERVTELLADPQVPTFLRQRLSICHAAAEGHHAVKSLLSACMSRGIQSLPGLAHSFGAAAHANSQFKEAVEAAEAAANVLERIECELRGQDDSHLDLWFCCHELAGLRKIVGAIFARQVGLRRLGAEWLRRSFDDFRRAIDAGRDNGEAINVLKSALDAKSIAVFLHNNSAIEELDRVIESTRQPLSNESVAEEMEDARSSDPLAVSDDRFDRETPYLTNEAEIREFVDKIMEATGFPEERRRSIDDDVRKQIQTDHVQRDFCRYLRPLQNLEHLSSPATAYLFTTKYTCSCALTGWETRIEHDDLDTVIAAMKRVYCDECDRRSPGVSRD